MTDSFALDPRLAADSHPVADWPLCSVRLFDDRRWPWLLLVPRRTGIRELFELSPADRGVLVEEAARAAELLTRLGPCDKTNVATLGNMVAQLHVHVIARRVGDPAWPGPVWGVGTAERYEAGARDRLAGEVAALMQGGFAPPAGTGGRSA